MLGTGRSAQVTTASRGDEVANILQRIVFDKEAVCWGWRGTVAGTRPYFNQVPATRAVWKVFGNEVPDQYELHHTCHNGWCVNPWHLRPMLRAEHMRNHALDKRDRTHCANGHEWTPENTAFRDRGVYIKHRECRVCARGQAARRRASQ